MITETKNLQDRFEQFYSTIYLPKYQSFKHSVLQDLQHDNLSLFVLQVAFLIGKDPV